MAALAIVVVCVYMLYRFLALKKTSRVANASSVVPPAVLPTPNEHSAGESQSAQLRREMFGDVSTSLRTLEREYTKLCASPLDDSDEARRAWLGGTMDVRTVLGRLRLVVPSMLAGQMLRPDLEAYRAQAEDALTQAHNDASQLGHEAALARHLTAFHDALPALLECCRLSFNMWIATPDALIAAESSAEATSQLGARIERAHRSTHMLHTSLSSR